jgi:hypothetical protein
MSKVRSYRSDLTKESITPRVESRFWKNVDQREEDECWPWTGCRTHGYGALHFDRRNGVELSHRISYVIHYGSISYGVCICHRCDNPICVNPNHLFPGTQSENMRDMWKKGRGRVFHHQGERNPASKLSESAVLEIIKMRTGGKKLSEMSKMFGVSKSNISSICRGKTWPHVLRSEAERIETRIQKEDQRDT